MPGYYPVFLDLKERHCAIIGGGDVAGGKIQGLLECGARVTVISPTLTTHLQSLHHQGAIQWEARSYQHGDLDGVFLAIAATNDNGINRQVAAEAEERNVILNVVDVTPLCTFIAPAVVRRGDITLAISTGGASPALARKLREALSISPILQWADITPLLSQARQELRRQNIQVDPDHWQACLTSELLALFQDGRELEAWEYLMGKLTNGRTTPPNGAVQE